MPRVNVHSDGRTAGSSPPRTLAPQPKVKKTRPRIVGTLLWLPLMLVLLTGCLEQIQTTRIAAGSLSNFLIHLVHGELDDARAYFAPGLVTPTPELDASLQGASNRLKQYEIRGTKAIEEDMANGEKLVIINGQTRPRAQAGSPTPGPDEGWQNTEIISATMIVRGPGWRILDFKLLCCEAR
ncbi:MAG: hypothetical protein ABJA50_02835 [Chloroflexota bacterium]